MGQPDKVAMPAGRLEGFATTTSQKIDRAICRDEIHRRRKTIANHELRYKLRQGPNLRIS